MNNNETPEERESRESLEFVEATRARRIESDALYSKFSDTGIGLGPSPLQKDEQEDLDSLEWYQKLKKKPN